MSEMRDDAQEELPEMDLPEFKVTLMAGGANFQVLDEYDTVTEKLDDAGPMDFIQFTALTCRTVGGPEVRDMGFFQMVAAGEPVQHRHNVTRLRLRRDTIAGYLERPSEETDHVG